MEIRINEMNPHDEIAIRTQWSDYRFRLTDPVIGRGVLSGGRFGIEEHDAILAGTISSIPTEPSSNHQLKAGGRAVFLVGTNLLRWMTTSVIKEIHLNNSLL